MINTYVYRIWVWQVSPTNLHLDMLAITYYNPLIYMYICHQMYVGGIGFEPEYGIDDTYEDIATNSSNTLCCIAQVLVA